MMKMIKTNYQAKKEKDKKDTELRVKRFKEGKIAEEMRKMKRQKELRKKICRTISKMEGAKAAGGSNKRSKH